MGLMKFDVGLRRREKEEFTKPEWLEVYLNPPPVPPPEEEDVDGVKVGYYPSAASMTLFLPPALASGVEDYLKAVVRVYNRLLEDRPGLFNSWLEKAKDELYAADLENRFARMIAVVEEYAPRYKVVIPRPTPPLRHVAAAYLSGLGPLYTLLRAENLINVELVEPYKNIFMITAEHSRYGRLQLARVNVNGTEKVTFSEPFFRRAASRAAWLGGSELSEAFPYQNLSFSLGERNYRVVINISRLIGPRTVTVRLHRRKPFTPVEYIAEGGATSFVFALVAEALFNRFAVLVYGPPGSGKTTFIATALHHAPLDTERVIVIQDAGAKEINLTYPTLILRSSLERQSLYEFAEKTNLTKSDMMRFALRENASIIAVSEVTSQEDIAAFLNAINTSGGITSIHANDPDTLLARLRFIASQENIEESTLLNILLTVEMARTVVFTPRSVPVQHFYVRSVSVLVVEGEQVRLLPMLRRLNPGDAFEQNEEALRAFATRVAARKGVGQAAVLRELEAIENIIDRLYENYRSGDASLANNERYIDVFLSLLRAIRRGAAPAVHDIRSPPPVAAPRIPAHVLEKVPVRPHRGAVAASPSEKTRLVLEKLRKARARIRET